MAGARFDRILLNRADLRRPFPAGFARRPPEWQRYHSSFHTSSKELAGIASKARPGLLVLYHQLQWGVTPEQLLDEMKQGYQGNVVFGNDLDIY